MSLCALPWAIAHANSMGMHYSRQAISMSYCPWQSKQRYYPRTFTSSLESCTGCMK